MTATIYIMNCNSAFSLWLLIIANRESFHLDSAHDNHPIGRNSKALYVGDTIATRTAVKQRIHA